LTSFPWCKILLSSFSFITRSLLFIYLFYFDPFAYCIPPADIQTFQDLHTWSVTQRASFWDSIWHEFGLIHSGTYTRVVDESVRMDKLPRWFEGTHLNFAENLLYSHEPGSPFTQRSKTGKEDAKIAITEVREGCSSLRHVTWAELRDKVGVLANALRAKGLKKGDRVAVVASNSVDTLVCFLATTALGGLFSSSSTDMGTKGILDRLRQIRPKFVFVDDGAEYNGKRVDLRGKLGEIVEGMRDVKEFEGLVVQPRWTEPLDISSLSRSVSLMEFLQSADGKRECSFERVAFRDPFLIVYSSGTTGMPKCIVHSTGGVLANSMKEGKLHNDYRPDTVKLQYTTVS
jgi:acetoacetyl-CoA synthetase